jgi:excisionase family DNA binding protein
VELSTQAGPSRRQTGRLLSAQEGAFYLGVPYTSLRDWANRGHIPIVRVPNCRRIWFDRRDLDRLVEVWKERLEPGDLVSLRKE